MAEQQDYDSPWKDILDLQFEEFMAFFFPTAHAQIDWRAGYEFLDKELQKDHAGCCARPALENENNPFAVVVMAHAGTRATATDPHARLDWKFRLTRRLFERGVYRQQIIGLYRFIQGHGVAGGPGDGIRPASRRISGGAQDGVPEFNGALRHGARSAGWYPGRYATGCAHAARHAARRTIRTGCHGTASVDTALGDVVQRG